MMGWRLQGAHLGWSVALMAGMGRDALVAGRDSRRAADARDCTHSTAAGVGR